MLFFGEGSIKLSLQIIVILPHISLFENRFEREQDDSVLHVSHEAKYEVFYEPFYVSLDTAPPHDERFLGYGFTRNSQVIYNVLFIEYSYLCFKVAHCYITHCAKYLNDFFR